MLTRMLLTICWVLSCQLGADGPRAQSAGRGVYRYYVTVEAWTVQRHQTSSLAGHCFAHARAAHGMGWSVMLCTHKAKSCLTLCVHQPPGGARGSKLTCQHLTASRVLPAFRDSAAELNPKC